MFTVREQNLWMATLLSIPPTFYCSFVMQMERKWRRAIKRKVNLRSFWARHIKNSTPFLWDIKSKDAYKWQFTMPLQIEVRYVTKATHEYYKMKSIWKHLIYIIFTIGKNFCHFLCFSIKHISVVLSHRKNSCMRDWTANS